MQATFNTLQQNPFLRAHRSNFASSSPIDQSTDTEQEQEQEQATRPSQENDGMFDERNEDTYASIAEEQPPPVSQQSNQQNEHNELSEQSEQRSETAEAAAEERPMASSQDSRPEGGNPAGENAETENASALDVIMMEPSTSSDRLGEIPDGVDPSFLDALPPEMRREVSLLCLAYNLLSVLIQLCHVIIVNV